MEKISVVSTADLRAVLASMLDSWETRAPEVQVAENGEQNQYTLVLGLAAHAHRLGRAALSMFDAGFTLETLPTVRAIYEHAITAQWLALHADGAIDFINEYGRQRNAAVGTLKKSGLKDMEAATGVLKQDPWDAIPSHSAQQAKNTEMLLEDLHPGGQEAYFYYRLLSSLTHPTGKVVDQYLTEGPLTLHLREKDPDSAFMWMFLTCLGILLNGTAVDKLEEGRPRKAELDNIGHLLQTPSEFELSAKFEARMAKATQRNAAP